MDNPKKMKPLKPTKIILEITSSTATAIHAASDALFPLFNPFIPCKQAFFIVSRYCGNRA